MERKNSTYLDLFIAALQHFHGQQEGIPCRVSRGRRAEASDEQEDRVAPAETRYTLLLLLYPGLFLISYFLGGRGDVVGTSEGGGSDATLNRHSSHDFQQERSKGVGRQGEGDHSRKRSRRPTKPYLVGPYRVLVHLSSPLALIRADATAAVGPAPGLPHPR